MPPKSGSWWFCPEVPCNRWKTVWVLVQLPDGTELEAHWACDLTGEEQPPFRGWFNRQYRQVPQPLLWRRI